MNENSEIKVSVIVTTYNQETTIAQTLDSILMQQCDFPFEIQLSDDCSTDSTPDICLRYAEKYPHIISYVRNQANRGCRDNYFDTLLRCKAPYIADCAGDDYWIDPHKLQKQADVLDSDADITLVHTNWAYLNSYTGAVSPSEPERLRKDLLKPCSGHGEMFVHVLRNRGMNLIHPCTAMYRRDTIMVEYTRDIGLFRNSDFPCEDMQLRCICAYHGKIAYLNDVTLHYRTGHASVSSQDNYLKTFDFYFGSLKLSTYIAKKYEVAHEVTADVFAHDAGFLFAQAFAARNRRRLDDLMAFLDSHGIALPFNSRICLPFTRNNMAWKCAGAIKPLVARLKRLAHDRS